MSNKIKISLADPQVKEIWDSAVEAKREVESWPAWKRGEEVSPDSDPPATTTAVATPTTKTTL